MATFSRPTSSAAASVSASSRRVKASPSASVVRYRLCWARGSPLAEAAEEATKDTALRGQRGGRRRGGWPLVGDRLIVVGPGDRVDGLLDVEVPGTLDGRD